MFLHVYFILFEKNYVIMLMLNACIFDVHAKYIWACVLYTFLTDSRNKYVGYMGMM